MKNCPEMQLFIYADVGHKLKKNTMKKRLNQLLQIALGILTPLIFVLVTILISLSKQLQAANFDKYPLYIGAILSLIFVFFFKKKKTYFLSGITISILFIGLNFLMNNFGHKHSNRFSDHSTIWNNTKHSTTIPFYSSESGHIFLKAKIGNETKYILFDTGADLCGFNEKYNVLKNDTIFITSITDSNGKKNQMEIHRLNNLSIGDLDFEKNHYISMNNDIWKKECGIFFNQDSIAGALGNNIINSFVWDFDMLNKTLKISKKTELQNISRADIIPLFKRGKKSWYVKIKINGKRKSVTLDSGYAGNLKIKDSITLRENYNYKIGRSKSKGLFSYKDCDKKKDRSEITREVQKGKRKIFVDLSISNTTFKDILIEDTSNMNLLGIPLFWEYERVILDFLNGKMYLFNKINDSKHPKSIATISNKAKELLRKKPVPNNGYKKLLNSVK